MPNLRHRLLGTLGGVVLGLLNRSLRWRQLGRADAAEIFSVARPSIIALWHCRQLSGAWIYRLMAKADSAQLYTLISKHGDGRIVSAAVRLFGVRSVAGSSTRGGREAARELIELLQNGSCICITPDGPRGPAQQSKQGIIKIAQLTGARIFPVSVGFSRSWRVGSWDRMFIPKPFARAVYGFGEPMIVPESLTAEQVEHCARELDARLNQLDQQVDCAAANEASSARKERPACTQP